MAFPSISLTSIFPAIILIILWHIWYIHFDNFVHIFQITVVVVTLHTTLLLLQYPYDGTLFLLCINIIYTWHVGLRKLKPNTSIIIIIIIHIVIIMNASIVNHISHWYLWLEKHFVDYLVGTNIYILYFYTYRLSFYSVL